MQESIGRLFTIGKICERIQAPPAVIESSIEALGIEPVIVLNDLRYYSIDDEGKIFDHLKEIMAERVRHIQRPA